MVNYFWLEYFRRLAGVSMNEMSAVCGDAHDNRKYYSKALEVHTDSMPKDQINAMADLLGIVPEWITQSPIVYTKQDLDNYIAVHKRTSLSELVKPSSKPNQYEIVSQPAAMALSELSAQLRGVTPNEELEILKKAFKHDPDHIKMPLRSMINFALLKYDSLPEFAKAMASMNRDTINDAKLNALISKLVMARTLPETTVDRKVFDCFVLFANITYDQALCDFRVSSDESVFNLFLATYISLSAWTIAEDEKTGEWILTLTDPTLLPSSMPMSNADLAASIIV